MTLMSSKPSSIRQNHSEFYLSEDDESEAFRGDGSDDDLGLSGGAEGEVDSTTPLRGHTGRSGISIFCDEDSGIHATASAATSYESQAQGDLQNSIKLAQERLKSRRERYRSPTVELWNSVSGTLNGNPMRVFLLVLGVLVFVMLKPPTRTMYPSAKEILAKVHDVPLLKDAFAFIGIKDDAKGKHVEAEKATVSDSDSEKREKKEAIKEPTPYSTFSQPTVAEEPRPHSKVTRSATAKKVTNNENESHKDYPQEAKDVVHRDSDVNKSGVDNANIKRITDANALLPAQDGNNVATPEVRELPDALSTEGQKRRSELRMLGRTDDEIRAFKLKQAKDFSKLISETEGKLDEIHPDMKTVSPVQLVKEAIEAKDPEEAAQLSRAAGAKKALQGIAGVTADTVKLVDDLPLIGDEEVPAFTSAQRRSAGPPAKQESPSTAHYRNTSLFNKIKSRIDEQRKNSAAKPN